MTTIVLTDELQEEVLMYAINQTLNTNLKDAVRSNVKSSKRKTSQGVLVDVSPQHVEQLYDAVIMCLHTNPTGEDDEVWEDAVNAVMAELEEY